MNKQKTKLAFSLFVTVFLVLGLSMSFQSLLAAWTVPAATPPDGNVPEPINKDSLLQVKGGPLYVNMDGIASTGLTASKDVLLNDYPNCGKLNTDGTGKVACGSENQNLDSVLTNGNSVGNNNINLNNKDILSGRFCPTGTCGATTNMLASDGLHSDSIYAGAAGEVDLWAQANMNNNKIVGVPLNPTTDTEAASKKYVDTAVQAAGGGGACTTFAPKDGVYNNCSVYCDTGWKLVFGGCKYNGSMANNQVNDSLQHSYPVTSGTQQGWFCAVSYQFYNQGTTYYGPYCGTAYALCCR